VTTSTPTSTHTPTRGPGRPRVGPRFEILLPESWRDELDAIAEENATTRAAVVREALEVAYGDRLPELPHSPTAYRSHAPGLGKSRDAARRRAREAAIAALEAEVKRLEKLNGSTRPLSADR
jgi:hypothetical protein